MKEPFLCVKSKSAPFLIPLPMVRHILPETMRKDGTVLFEGEDIRTVDLSRLWQEESTGSEAYVVLLHHGLGLFGVAVMDVPGVFEISGEDQMEIPGAARGAGNAWIRKAAYIDSLDLWAFCVDDGFVDKLEELWDGTEREEQAGCADADLDR